MVEQKTSILNIMVKDHQVIEEYIDKVKRNLNDDFDVIKRSFNDFEWQLEKHIFAEERAIFTFYKSEDIPSGYKMVPVLKKQHNDILDRLEIMRRMVQKKQIPEKINEFKKILIKHRRFEEIDVYPKLQDSLSEKQKDQIIEKVKTII